MSVIIDWRLLRAMDAYRDLSSVMIYRPGRLGRAKPRAEAWSRDGCTSSCSRSAVISSGPEASICHSIVSDCISTIPSVHTFFRIWRPSPSATAMALLRELACSIRSLMDEPVGQVYTNTTTSDPG